MQPDAPDDPAAAPDTVSAGGTDTRTGSAGTGTDAITGSGATGTGTTGRAGMDPFHAQYEDGNALAGPLSELLAVDPTTALGRCTDCGAGWPLARLRVYSRAPGYVGRCPECDRVILRLVPTPDRLVLDLRGTVALSFPRDPLET